MYKHPTYTSLRPTCTAFRWLGVHGLTILRYTPSTCRPMKTTKVEPRQAFQKRSSLRLSLHREFSWDPSAMLRRNSIRGSDQSLSDQESAPLTSPPLWAHRAGVRPRARRQLCTHHAQWRATSPSPLKLHKCFALVCKAVYSLYRFRKLHPRVYKRASKGRAPNLSGGPRAKQCPRDSYLAVLLQESVWLDPALLHRLPITSARASII